MRILQIISSAGMYGAERVVLGLARNLETTGHEVQIAVFENRHAPNLEIVRAAEELKVKAVLVPCRGRLDSKSITHLKNLAASYLPDIVHTHGYKADIYGYAAMRSMPVALVSTCHGWVENNMPLRVYGLADRWALREFDVAVAASTEIAERLRRARVSADKVRVIGNGVDLPEVLPTPALRHDLGLSPDCLLVGAVGRLSPEKGFSILVSAARTVIQLHPHVRFVVVGDGAQRVELEELTRRSGLEGRFFWTGRREDMSGVYASFDIQVQPSLQEGLPMAILEGMAAAKAIVATRVGDVASAIDLEKTGLLVNPGDVDEIAAAIARLVGDPALRTRLGQAGRARVQANFSVRAMTERYLAAYGEAINRSSIRHGNNPNR